MLSKQKIFKHMPRQAPPPLQPNIYSKSSFSKLFPWCKAFNQYFSNTLKHNSAICRCRSLIDSTSFFFLMTNESFQLTIQIVCGLEKICLPSFFFAIKLLGYAIQLLVSFIIDEKSSSCTEKFIIDFGKVYSFHNLYDDIKMFQMKALFQVMMSGEQSIFLSCGKYCASRLELQRTLTEKH